MFNQQLMNMKIQLKYLQNRTSNIRQDYIRKRYREAINHPLIDFTMRSLLHPTHRPPQLYNTVPPLYESGFEY